MLENGYFNEEFLKQIRKNNCFSHKDWKNVNSLGYMNDNQYNYNRYLYN